MKGIRGNFENTITCKKIICIPPIIFLKVCLFNLIQGYPFLTSAFPVKCNDRRVIKVVTKGSNEVDRFSSAVQEIC